MDQAAGMTLTSMVKVAVAHYGVVVTNVEAVTMMTDVHAEKLVPLRSNDYFWIGLTDIQGEGIWRVYSSKSLLTSTGFSSWEPGRPDNVGGKKNCGQIRPDSLWGDNPCHVFKFYICEKPLE
ncbi:hepatic lectin-like [Ruditapes philippinarum]|uniref:hepatic lectin-like n=1 Tax=Ruditapes philippinarum TaxID=129788 RepID=UPI00295AC50E|nr:hepatic lectin-like [Ruditapes philippinarum]